MVATRGDVSFIDASKQCYDGEVELTIPKPPNELDEPADPSLPLNRVDDQLGAGIRYC